MDLHIPDIKEAQLWQAGQVRYAGLRHRGFPQLQLRYVRLRPLQLLCSERLACNTTTKSHESRAQACNTTTKSHESRAQAAAREAIYSVCL